MVGNCPSWARASNNKPLSVSCEQSDSRDALKPLSSGTLVDAGTGAGSEANSSGIFFCRAARSLAAARMPMSIVSVVRMGVSADASSSKHHKSNAARYRSIVASSAGNTVRASVVDKFPVVNYIAIGGARLRCLSPTRSMRFWNAGSKSGSLVKLISFACGSAWINRYA